MLCRGLEFIRKQMDQIRLECVRACVAACVRPCACVCACVCVYTKCQCREEEINYSI